ncbi:U7 snRNA-associated Sm-like protein LSm11 [Pyrgilauda ruficollis]|uniref:U7 snRNA-associated Sm-like protein LSm11 n=1 Tax=Pyrgilauda ruficollis TaxID=221976 RepID=UPI001B86116F|nr:U7 snRNA-associated Sm-like protein LSm11 [Pyrgilauda ruficollis]
MEEDEAGAASAEPRGSRRRSPSPGRLDVSSSRFDPLLALYSPRTPLPFPAAPCFNNLAESERIQRLRSLMVNAGPEQEAAEGGTATRRRRAPRNVLTRMPLHEGSPLGELHRCVRDGVRINVHIRTFKGLRGVCTGFLVAFDKFWNMALTDVDETYRKPVMGKAFYAEPQLSLTRLFDRLKLQESSGKKGADSKTVSQELALTNDSHMLSLKAGSGRGRGAEEERERQKHLGRAGEKKTPGDRSEADVGSRTAHTEGASAGGARAKSQPRRRRRPKVDYQQVFTRHINQIFIRGENVLLVHLAH